MSGSARPALRRLAAHRGAVLGVLGLGLALRVWAVQHARFDFDEAHSWQVSLGIARAHAFPAHGVPISGSDATTPGPLFYYVTALPLLLWSDPRAGALFLAALNLLGVWLVFRALRDDGEDDAAGAWLITASASPWMVVYADRIWSANLLLPLGAAAVFALAGLLRRRGSRLAALLGFVLVVGFQVHASCLHLWTVALLAGLVLRPRLDLRWLAGGMALGALTYLPYLVREWASGFANTQALLVQAGARLRGARPLLGMLLHYLGFPTTDVSYLVARGFFSGFDHFDFWGQDGLARTQAHYAAGGAAALSWAVHAAGWALVLAGVVLAARRLARPAQRRPWDVMFAAAGASVAALQLLSGRGGFAHYALVVAPLAFWPLLLALRGLARGRLWPLAAAYLAAAVPAGWLALRAYYEADGRQSVAQQHRVVSFVLAQAGAEPFEIRLGWREGRTSTYGLLAREYHRAAWRAAPQAAQVFTVVPRGELAAAAPPGRVVATAELGSLTVIHTRR